MGATLRSLRVAFAGTPDFAVEALRAIMASNHRLVLVFTQPDRPAGRGQKLMPSPVKACAVANAIPVYQPSRMGPEAAALLRRERIDVLVVAAFGQIVSEEILCAPINGCINIHASLLPRWRGAAPIVHALLSGDALSGVSIMKMDRGLDTGPTLLMRSCPITATMTQGDLLSALSGLGATACVEVLDDLDAYLSTAREQPQKGVTYAGKITKSQALIDWEGTADDVSRHVRAFNPFPMAYAFWCGQRVRIAEVSVFADDCVGAHAPGEVISVDGRGVLVACTVGAVGITRLQLPGKTMVSSASFDERMRSFFNGGRFTSSVD